jgi:hypothetical protein
MAGGLMLLVVVWLESTNVVQTAQHSSEVGGA